MFKLQSVSAGGARAAAFLKAFKWFFIACMQEIPF
jgi:hypothetical protein